MRPWVGAVRDVLLYAGAALGLIVVGWLIVAQLTGAALIAVQTGSMSPAIPSGSLIVATMVPVNDVEVGDVVTTRLDDASPLITHRVVRIVPAESGVSLVLKGDANQTEDLFPYQVDQVLKTKWSISGGAHVLNAVRSPLGATIMAIGVGGLVAYALWPSTQASPKIGRRRLR